MGHWRIDESLALADCAFEIEARTLPDLFATAARALSDLMVDPATVTPSIERTVTLTAPTLELLLFDFLSELIFLKDSEQLVFPEAAVDIARRPVPRLTARLRGAPLDSPHAALRADPKAVTLHRLAVFPVDHGWQARAVIDI
jgi:SHS2 domain-containing protein